MTVELHSDRLISHIKERNKMCVAATGKVIRVTDKIADVDFNGNTVRAHCGIIPVKEGDNVLVHAGLIIQVIGEKDVEEMKKLFDELEELK